MGNIETLTKWHRAQLGTRETGKNNVIYNTRYYGREVNGDEYPWCCAYIWDSFAQNGLSSLFYDGKKTAYCPTAMAWAKKAGLWVTSGYREGDILLYDWNGNGVADHIGYCIRWDGSKAVAIEGNADDAVTMQTRYAKNILGAIRPKYDDAVPAVSTSKPEGGETVVAKVTKTCTVTLPQLQTGSEGSAVLGLQTLLVHKWGCKLPKYGPDGEFGEETREAVLRFQRTKGLEADGVVGSKTWTALIGG